MGRRKRTNFSDSLQMNVQNYAFYTERLTELALSMFEWKNLPETIDSRFLELTLFSDGSAIFFNDEELGFLCLQVALNGTFNVYRIPIERRAYAINGYQKQLNIDNSVIIYNNLVRTNTEPCVRRYAKRLSDLDATIDINAKAQKTPILITCTEQQRLTMLNLYKEYDGNSPVIFGDKNLDIKGMQVLKTDAPYVADKIYELKNNIWNEALTFLGISNLNVQKKERLITDETIRSQGGTIASRYSRLNARRQACEEINRMFGLDIWVDYREDYREAGDVMMLAGQSGDESLDTLTVDV